MKEHYKEDKKYLKNLCEALDISEGRLRRDECGDWNIFGRKGHISTDSELWYLYISCRSKRHWSSVKTKLSFMIVSQDGDDEGILRLERMPSQKESEVIRELIGLNKRPALTEEYRQLLVRRANNARNKGVSSSQIDLNEKEVS